MLRVPLQDALAALKSGRLPPPGDLPSFENLQEIVGFPQYYAEEQRYTTDSTAAPFKRSLGLCYTIFIHMLLMTQSIWPIFYLSFVPALIVILSWVPFSH